MKRKKDNTNKPLDTEGQPTPHKIEGSEKVDIKFDTENIKPADENNDGQQKGGMTLEEEMEAFEKNTSTFVPEVKKELNTVTNTASQPVTNSSAVLPQASFESTFKLRKMVGLICFLIAGANKVILNYLRDAHVPMDKMKFTEEEKDEIMPYLNSPEILAWIDKLPAWAIGVMHIEGIMIEKHNDLAKDYMNEPKTEEK